MALPTKAQWTNLKANAGIAKSPWYKKADAAVGPALAKLEAARNKWKAAKNADNARGYINALDDLNTAFQNFLAKKDLSAAGDLKASIEGWVQEVLDKSEHLRKKLPDLNDKNVKDLLGVLNQITLQD